jgi:hypothetical protein
LRIRSDAATCQLQNGVDAWLACDRSAIRFGAGSSAVWDRCHPSGSHATIRCGIKDNRHHHRHTDCPKALRAHHRESGSGDDERGYIHHRPVESRLLSSLWRVASWAAKPRIKSRTAKASAATAAGAITPGTGPDRLAHR